MFELNLESWEKIPDNFDIIKPKIQALCYPLMPEKPEKGVFYRIYPEGFVSGNGTAYHGGVRIGKNPKKLIIFFNGGGVSYDEYTVSRPSNAFTGHIEDTYYSNDGEWIGDYFLHTGMSSVREDNPFLDWSAIHIPYCNGDFHAGDGEFPYTAQDGTKRTMPYHGYRNAMSVIKMAKKWLEEPEQILIAGSSAGGFGVSLLADDVIEAFKSCQDVTLVVDSSLLISDKWSNIAREVWHSPEHISKRLTGNNLVLDSYTALYHKYGNRVRYLFMCSVRDALLVVAQNGLDGKGQIFNLESGVRFQKNLKHMCSQLMGNIPNVGLFIFTGQMDANAEPIGYDDALLTLHCALNNPYLFDHKEDGKTPCEWILNAMQGKIERLGLSNLEDKAKLEDYEIKHQNIVRKIAPECMVLLKSDGAFPLEKPDRLALYGSGARRTLKGGRGSGDVNVRAFSTVEEGLESAGFELTTKYWLEAYEKAWQEARVEFREWLKVKIAAEGMDMLMENLSIVMPEPDYEIPLIGEGDTAVYVLSRLCGEGVDRQDVLGDLRLSKTEIRDILQLEKQYKKFLLVLNTACIVDLSPVAEKVSNILLLSQPGMTVGDSFADVLLGKEYPSGKLAMTWAGSDICDLIGEFGDRNDTRYKEGVYVGYRYFDSVGKKPLFPFGFGLSYTDFLIDGGVPKLCGTKVCIPVKVKNTGKHPGKEVIQLYVSVPEKKLDQPYQVLAAFEKTKELKPDEEALIEVSFEMESLASYDAESVSRILEAGDYILRIGNSSRNTVNVGIIEINQEVITECVTLVGGTIDFDDWKPEEAEKKQAILTMTKSCPAIKNSILSDNNSEAVRLLLSASDFKQALHHTPEVDKEALALVKKLSDEELAYLCTGDFINEGSKSIIGDSAITVAGAAGETTGRFKEYGIQNLIMADGPAGLRLSREFGIDENGIFSIEPKVEEDKMELIPKYIIKALLSQFSALNKVERTGEIHEQNCTAIPVAAAIAQSFNIELAKTCGAIVADEMKHFGIDIWLAPSMNIQRHPLCGRNFEYYSEDPLISGKMAAGITQGVQKEPGLCVTIKHFICNNQETNRFRSNSMVSERALRDIYARGFEITVKEAKPLALMTSYNLLNGVHPSEIYALLETMLREEWGFQGIVMSDFLPGDESEADRTNKYKKFQSVRSIKAGLDLLMPGGKAHYENMLNALSDKSAKDSLSRKELEKCAARMAWFAWKLRLSSKIT